MNPKRLRTAVLCILFFTACSGVICFLAPPTGVAFATAETTHTRNLKSLRGGVQSAGTGRRKSKNNRRGTAVGQSLTEGVEQHHYNGVHRDFTAPGGRTNTRPHADVYRYHRQGDRTRETTSQFR